jgi:peroxiredoxin
VIRYFRVFSLVVVLAAGSLAWAGKYNKSLSIGDEAPTWKDLPGVDGKMHSLDDWKDKECLVVAFTCNTCPYAEDYEKRLIELSEKISADGKGALIAINSNKVKGDQLPDMEERAKARGFNFPYLHDETQEVARAYGATYTPEFVVLDRQRKVAYLGAFDDSTDAAKVKQRYVEEAVNAVLASKLPETTETPAVGCAVRYQRSKRTKKQ